MRWTHALLLAPFAVVALASDSSVDRHVAALQKAQSLQATITVTKVGGSTLEQTLSFTKPDKFRWESDAKLVVSDGKTLFTYDKAAKTYSKSEANAEALKKALSADAVWAWSAFFNDKFADDVASAQKGESRKLRNVPVTDVTVTLKDKRTFTLPLDDATGVARGARFSVEESGATSEVIVLVKELTLGDAGLQDSLFAWTPPADAKDAAEVAASAMKFAEVKPIFDQNCAGCHGGRAPKAGIDLSSYSGIMDSRAVRPGNPDGSRIMREIRSGKMPPAGPLAQELVDKLAKWIADGAKE